MKRRAPRRADRAIAGAVQILVTRDFRHRYSQSSSDLMFKVRILATAFACALALPAFAQEPTQPPNTGERSPPLQRTGTADAQGGARQRCHRSATAARISRSRRPTSSSCPAATSRISSATTPRARWPTPRSSPLAPRRGIAKASTTASTFPTTVFQAGNVIGSLRSRSAPAPLPTASARIVRNQKVAHSWPRHRPRAGPVAGDGADR